MQYFNVILIQVVVILLVSNTKQKYWIATTNNRPIESTLKAKVMKVMS